MFNIDQKRVYKKFNGEMSNERVIPNAEESRRFWKEIWDSTKELSKEAEWLKDLKRCERGVKQDNVVITVEMVRTQCRKYQTGRHLDLMECRDIGSKTACFTRMHCKTNG